MEDENVKGKSKKWRQTKQITIKKTGTKFKT
jgi:hypothetical protein